MQRLSRHRFCPLARARGSRRESSRSSDWLRHCFTAERAIRNHVAGLRSFIYDFLKNW